MTTEKQYEDILRYTLREAYTNLLLYGTFCMDKELTKDIQEVKKSQEQQIERNSL